MPEDAADHSAAVSQRRREREQRFLRDRTHVDGMTPGTVVEYDDWQWGIITEIDEDYEPAKVGFVLLDELSDDIIDELEPAWGCAEHYAVIEEFRGGEHEYWTDVDYIPEDDIWTVLGAIHPDERSEESEVVA